MESIKLIVGAREFMQQGKTAYLTEANVQAVYRLNYSWSRPSCVQRSLC